MGNCYGRKFFRSNQRRFTNNKKSWIGIDSKLQSDWYASNYWILNYLYYIDIEDILDYITEYRDKETMKKSL